MLTVANLWTPKEGRVRVAVAVAVAEGDILATQACQPPDNGLA